MNHVEETLRRAEESVGHSEKMPVVTLQQESSSGVEETAHSSVEEHEHKVDQIMQIKSEQEERLGRKMTDDELRLLCSAVANQNGCANGECGVQGDDLEGFNGRTSYAPAF
jgi:hypothetical protein